MKIELNLDMDKIDIDIINREVEKQLSQRNLKEDYDVEYKIEAKVDQFIASAVNDELYAYKDQYDRPTTKTTNIINKTVEEGISCKVKEFVDKIIEENYSEEQLKQLVVEIFPTSVTSILVDKLKSMIYSEKCDFNTYLHDMIRSEIEYSLRNKRY